LLASALTKSDETAHRNVKPPRRVTFRRVMSSYCREEHTIRGAGKLRDILPGRHPVTGRKPVSDFPAIADRFEIEALRGEFTDAAMMCDYDRLASLFIRAHRPARRQLAPELRHLPRPLPAHRRRLEVHRTRLRDQVPRHQPAGGLTVPGVMIEQKAVWESAFLARRMSHECDSLGPGVLPPSRGR